MLYSDFLEECAEQLHEVSRKRGYREHSVETLLAIVSTYVTLYDPGNFSEFHDKLFSSSTSLVNPEYQVTYNVTTPEVKVKKKKAKAKKKKVAPKKKRK